MIAIPVVLSAAVLLITFGRSHLAKRSCPFCGKRQPRTNMYYHPRVHWYCRPSEVSYFFDRSHR